MADAVTVDDLLVRRGKFVLDIPRWRVPEGAILGLVGANGAGKTTLLELLPGFYAPDSGQVRVLGLDPTEDTIGVRRSLGYMNDDLAVPWMTIRGMFRFLSGYWPTWDPGLVDELVGRFRLDTSRWTTSLSKGERTKLRLIMALAFRPRVVVLDEPATGLDVHGRRALLEIVVDIVRDPGRTVIISSHDLSDLERICDRLTVLEGGKIRSEGPTADIVGDGRTLEEVALSWRTP
jgi:ABC-2 type transport system ATP-binding protein